MTNLEFSNEFDVLYNSITSNQAPGLDEYEKSVFLTKAQDEILKSYFNPRSNKTQEGFDESEKRQIDFSMVMKTVVYQKAAAEPDPVTPTPSQGGEELTTSPSGSLIVLNPFTKSFFDLRSNTKAVTLNSDILMVVNEYVEVTRNDRTVRLTVLPINYNEYSRLMSKPYKRPVKNQAWRLFDNSSDTRKAELIVGPIDVIEKYVTRYIKRPRAIILDVLSEDTTLDGYVGADESGNPTSDLSKAVQGISCELDPILHQEILQRAVELAKAVYMGDLQNQLLLGQTSQTDIGAVQSSSRK